MADLAKIEQQLRARLAELTERADEVADELAEPLDNDMEEQLTEIDDQEVNQGLDDMVNQEIIQVRAALSRIEDGTYGTCSNCGKDIDPARLEAQPMATRCIDCAA
ncbi:TraR/DksA family transcriptional regulator [Pseudonocardia sp. TMWB2A]|uniref:TraR/DksA family transcriptional regulator n=1 Tax=Pseudonocardia sp. TMWB2A TaxID=687430 RepID=UPI00307E81F2